MPAPDPTAAEVARLRTALADAVCRPMGVIPASASGLLTAEDYVAATRRRPPWCGVGAPSMRPLSFVEEVPREE